MEHSGAWEEFVEQLQELLLGDLRSTGEVPETAGDLCARRPVLHVAEHASNLGRDRMWKSGTTLAIDINMKNMKLMNITRIIMIIACFIFQLHKSRSVTSLSVVAFISDLTSWLNEQPFDVRVEKWPASLV